MTGFVVFLTLTIVVHITAAPSAVNYADVYLENGSTGVVVVSNSSFGAGAFANNWRPPVHAQNRPDAGLPNLDSPTSCPPCPQGNKKPVSFSINGWITVENSTFGDGAFANHYFDKPIRVVNNQVLTDPDRQVPNVDSSTCPPCPQGRIPKGCWDFHYYDLYNDDKSLYKSAQGCLGNKIGESYGRNGASNWAVIENSKFGDGAFSRYDWPRAIYVLNNVLHVRNSK